MKRRLFAFSALFLITFSSFIGSSFSQEDKDNDKDNIIGTRKAVSIPVNKETGMGVKNMALNLPEDIDQPLYIVVSNLQLGFETSVSLLSNTNYFDICFGESYKICPIPKELLPEFEKDQGMISVNVKVVCVPHDIQMTYCPVEFVLYSQETGTMYMDFYDPDPEVMNDTSFYIDVNGLESEVYDLGIPCPMKELQRITIEAINPTNTNFDLLVSSESFTDYQDPKSVIPGASYEKGEMVTLNKDETGTWCQCCTIHVRIYAYTDVLIGLRAVGYPEVAELTTSQVDDAVVVGQYSHYHVNVCGQRGNCTIPEGKDILFSLVSSYGDPDMYINPSKLLENPQDSRFTSVNFFNDNLLMKGFARNLFQEEYFVSIYGPNQMGSTCTYSIQVREYKQYENFLGLKLITSQLKEEEVQNFYYVPDYNTSSFFTFVKNKEEKDELKFYLKECEFEKRFSDCTVTLEDVKDKDFVDQSNGTVILRESLGGFKSFMIHHCSVFENCFYVFALYGKKATNTTNNYIPFALKLYQFDPPLNMTGWVQYNSELGPGEYKMYEFIPNNLTKNGQAISEVNLKIYTDYGDNSIYIYAHPPKVDNPPPEDGKGEDPRKQEIKIYDDRHVPYPSGLRSITINSNLDYRYSVVIFTDTNTFFSLVAIPFVSGSENPLSSTLKLGNPYVGQIKSLDQVDLYSGEYSFSYESVWVNINEMHGKFDVYINFEKTDFPTRNTFDAKILPEDPMLRLDFGKNTTGNNGKLLIAVYPREGYIWDELAVLSYEISFNVGENKILLREGFPFKATIQPGEILTFYCWVSGKQVARVSVEDANYLGLLNTRVSVGGKKSKDESAWSAQSSMVLDESLLRQNCSSIVACIVWAEVQNLNPNNVSFLVEIQSGRSVTYMTEGQTYYVDYDPDNTLLESEFIFLVKDYNSHILVQADINVPNVFLLVDLVNVSDDKVSLSLKATKHNGFTAEFGLDDLEACKPNCQVHVVIAQNHWDVPLDTQKAEAWVTLVITTEDKTQELFVDKTELVTVQEGRSRFFELDTSFLKCNLNIILVPQLGDCSLGVNEISRGAPVEGRSQYNSQHMGFDIVNLDLTQKQSESRFMIGAFSEHRTSVCELSAVCTGKEYYNELRGGQPLRLMIKAGEPSIFYYQTTDPKINLVGLSWDSYNVAVDAYLNYVKGDSHITGDIPTKAHNKESASSGIIWDWEKSGFLYLADRQEVGYHWFYILSLTPKEDTFISVLVKTNIHYLDLDDGAVHMDFNYLSPKAANLSSLCSKFKVDNYEHVLRAQNISFNDNQKLQIPYSLTFQPIGPFVYTKDSLTMSIEGTPDYDLTFFASGEKPTGIINYGMPPLDTDVWYVDFCSSATYVYFVSGFSTLSTRILAIGEKVDSRLIPLQVLDFFVPVTNKVNIGNTLTMRIEYDTDYVQRNNDGKQTINNTQVNIPHLQFFEGWETIDGFSYIPMFIDTMQIVYSSYNSTIVKIAYKGLPLKVEITNQSPEDYIFFNIEAYFGDSIKSLELDTFHESVVSKGKSDNYAIYAPNTGFLEIKLSTCTGIVGIELVNSNTQERLYMNATSSEAGHEDQFSIFVNQGSYNLKVTGIKGVQMRDSWSIFSYGEVESELALYTLYTNFMDPENEEKKLANRIVTSEDTDNVKTKWLTNTLELEWSKTRVKYIAGGDEDYKIKYRVILTRTTELTDIISVCPGSTKYVINTQEAMQSSTWLRFEERKEDTICTNTGKCKFFISADIHFDFTMGRVVAAVYDKNGKEVARHYYNEFRVLFSVVKTGLGILQLIFVFSFIIGALCTCYLVYFSAKKVVKVVDDRAKEKFEMSDISAIVATKERMEKYSSLMDESKDQENQPKKLDTDEPKEEKPEENKEL